MDDRSNAGMSSDGGQGSTNVAPFPTAPSEARSSIQAEVAPTAEQIQTLTFSEVIRQLMMVKLDLEYYRNVVSLGVARTRRIAAIERAAQIVERAQREHTERKKLDRR